jgi:recombination associated protein RdgC
MLYKNLAICRFTSDKVPDLHTLNTALSKLPFTPCGAHDAARVGFVPPITGVDPDQEPFVRRISGGIMAFTLQKEEKVLPAQTVNRLLEEKVKALETDQERKLPSKEKKRVKDEVVFELLPRALTKQSKIHGVR